MAGGEYSKYVFPGLRPIQESQGCYVPAMPAGGQINTFIWDIWSHKFPDSKIWAECDLITNAGGFFHGNNSPMVSTIAGETAMGKVDEVGQELGRLGCHNHNVDEIFFLFGTDPAAPYSLGGEYEFWLGEGENAEKFIFTENTCVYAPAGVTHNPHGCLKLDDPTHPIVFMAILLEPGHAFETTTSYPLDENGERMFPPEFVKEHGLHP
jgi:hypothetical protein